MTKQSLLAGFIVGVIVGLFTIALVKKHSNPPTNQNVSPMVNNYNHVKFEGVVELVEQIDKDHVRITLDSGVKEYECRLPADEFLVGEYYTIVAQGPVVEQVYFGETSKGDMTDLPMVYDN